MLAPDAALHEANTEVVGPEGFYPFFDRMQATVSDVQVTVHDTIAEDDRICVRWTCTAKHTGAGLGMPPTGQSVRVTGITIHHVRAGGESDAPQKAPTYVAAP